MAVPCWSVVKLVPHSEHRTWFGNKNRGGRSRRQTWFYGRFRRWERRPLVPDWSVLPLPFSSPDPCNSQIAGAISCGEQNTANQKAATFSISKLVAPFWRDF